MQPWELTKYGLLTWYFWNGLEGSIFSEGQIKGDEDIPRAIDPTVTNCIQKPLLYMMKLW